MLAALNDKLTKINDLIKFIYFKFVLKKLIYVVYQNYKIKKIKSV